LLFQESRLDHLRGIRKPSGARGLGQFSTFGFYEINHELNKFHSGSLDAWIELFGHDVRPVLPDADRTNNLSSYFNIPTAVVASASYLNNRYHHLARLLRKHNVSVDPQVLWLHSLLAYNKGTRAVIALWKEARSMRPRSSTEMFVSPETFLAVATHHALFTRAFRRIWPENRARAYAKEAVRHVQNISACALQKGEMP
jgi:hypothetical protein